MKDRAAMLENKEAIDITENLRGKIDFACSPKHGNILVYNDAHGTISQMCPVCGKITRFDSDRMTATPAQPVKGLMTLLNRKKNTTNH